MLGSHTVKHWSTTQSTIALSSGEAELGGIVRGAAQGLGFHSLCKDLGFDVTLNILTDPSAAIGTCKRRRVGNVRHIAVTDLWVQDRLQSGDFKITKTPGSQNPADALTKFVDKPKLLKHLRGMRLEEETGRADSAARIV